MERTRFNQRLIGAFVLVLLAVILLPMILSGEDDPRSEASDEANRHHGMKTLVMRLDDRHRVTQVSVLGESAPALPAPPAANAPPVEIPAGVPVVEPAAVAQVPVQQEAAPTPETPAGQPAVTEKVAEPEAPQVVWVVQAGSFTSEENASALHAGLQKKGFASILVIQEKDGAPVYKIRVGPYDDEAAARAVADDMQAAGFKARVTRFKRWKR